MFHRGHYYDSKAIAGVAQGYEPGSAGPLIWEEFSGGEATVQRALERLKFTVLCIPGGPPQTQVPLVLVENEITAGGEYDFWADDTGVLYQYPNGYRNRVQSGLPRGHSAIRPSGATGRPTVITNKERRVLMWELFSSDRAIDLMVPHQQIGKHELCLAYACVWGG